HTIEEFHRNSASVKGLEDVLTIPLAYDPGLYELRVSPTGGRTFGMNATSRRFGAVASGRFIALRHNAPIATIFR
ncbi:MAG TPA: hypothetical protein VKU81_03280, partial [Casimicrobiaceae bacterium]|nr:hypothetical protein [Casimicrobiaceae bacterium]